jgi:hypothetical protein
LFLRYLHASFFSLPSLLKFPFSVRPSRDTVFKICYFVFVLRWGLTMLPRIFSNS